MHGKCATLHLEKLWIRDVTITTGLVDTATTPKLLKLIEGGRLDPTVFATHHFALDETEAAYDVFAAAAETHALKVVLDGSSGRLRAKRDGCEPTAGGCLDHASEPRSRCGGHGLDIRPQAVVARHLHDLPQRPGGRHSERVSLPLHDQRRHASPRRARVAGSARERPIVAEAAAGTRDRARRSRRSHPPSDRRPARPTSDRRRAAAGPRASGEQLLDDRDPGDVELARGRGRASSRDAVGLLDQHDADPERPRDARHCNEIARPHAAARAVAEHERGAGIVRGVQVRVRATVRRLDFLAVHALMC